MQYNFGHTHSSQDFILVERIPSQAHDHGENANVVLAKLSLAVFRRQYLGPSIVDSGLGDATYGRDRLVGKIGLIGIIDLSSREGNICSNQLGIQAPCPRGQNLSEQAQRVRWEMGLRGSRGRRSGDELCGTLWSGGGPQGVVGAERPPQQWTSMW